MWRVLATVPLASCRFMRFDLRQHHHARCLDGSPGGGYIRSRAGSNIVVMSLRGGGYCDSAKSCGARQLTPLGSSRMWSDRCTDCAMDLTDPDCGINPDFCNATLVILQYCSGDRWLGSANGATTWPGNNASFFFAGAHIVRAAITELVERGFVKTGSTLFLAGHGAGAIGVFSCAEMVSTKLVPQGVAVKAFLGWALGSDHPPPPPDVAAASHVPFYASGGPLDQVCRRENCWDRFRPRTPLTCSVLRPLYHNTPWRCLNAPAVAVSTLKVSTFVATSPASPLATGGALALQGSACAYVHDFAREATRDLQGLAAAALSERGVRLGVFAPACWRHDIPWETTIHGTSLRQAVGNWFHERSPVAYVEDCALRGEFPCNSCGAKGAKVADDCAAEASDRAPAGATGFRCSPEDAVVRGEYVAKGAYIARRFVPSDLLEDMSRSLDETVAQYARRLRRDGHLPRDALTRDYMALGRTHAWSALYADHARWARDNGRAVSLPTYYRKETHTEAFWNFINSKRLKGLLGCLLGTDALKMCDHVVGNMYSFGDQQTCAFLGIQFTWPGAKYPTLSRAAR